MYMRYTLCSSIDTFRPVVDKIAKKTSFFVENKQEFERSCGILFIMIGLEGG